VINNIGNGDGNQQKSNHSNEIAKELENTSQNAVNSDHETIVEDLLPAGESATNVENESGGIFSKMKAFVKKSQENILSIGSDKKKAAIPLPPEVDISDEVLLRQADSEVINLSDELRNTYMSQTEVTKIGKALVDETGLGKDNNRNAVDNQKSPEERNSKSALANGNKRVEIVNSRILETALDVSSKTKTSDDLQSAVHDTNDNSPILYSGHEIALKESEKNSQVSSDILSLSKNISLATVDNISTVPAVTILEHKSTGSSFLPEVPQTMEESSTLFVQSAKNEETKSGGIFSKLKSFVTKSPESPTPTVSDKPKVALAITQPVNDGSNLDSHPLDARLNETGSEIITANGVVPDHDSIHHKQITDLGRLDPYDTDLEVVSKNYASQNERSFEAIRGIVSKNVTDSTHKTTTDKDQQLSVRAATIPNSLPEASLKKSDEADYQSIGPLDLLSSKTENLGLLLLDSSSENVKKFDHEIPRMDLGADVQKLLADVPEASPLSANATKHDENESEGIFSKMKAFMKNSQESILSIGPSKTKQTTAKTSEMKDESILNSTPGISISSDDISRDFYYSELEKNDSATTQERITDKYRALANENDLKLISQVDASQNKKSSKSSNKGNVLMYATEDTVKPAVKEDAQLLVHSLENNLNTKVSMLDLSQDKSIRNNYSRPHELNQSASSINKLPAIDSLNNLKDAHVTNIIGQNILGVPSPSEILESFNEALPSNKSSTHAEKKSSIIFREMKNLGKNSQDQLLSIAPDNPKEAISANSKGTHESNLAEIPGDRLSNADSTEGIEHTNLPKYNDVQKEVSDQSKALSDISYLNFIGDTVTSDLKGVNDENEFENAKDVIDKTKANKSGKLLVQGIDKNVITPDSNLGGYPTKSSKINHESADQLSPSLSANKNLLDSNSDENVVNGKTSTIVGQEEPRTTLSQELSKTIDQVSLPSDQSTAHDKKVSDGMFSKMKAFVKKSQDNFLSIGSDKSKTVIPTAVEEVSIATTLDSQQVGELLNDSSEIYKTRDTLQNEDTPHKDSSDVGSAITVETHLDKITNHNLSQDGQRLETVNNKNVVLNAKDVTSIPMNNKWQQILVAETNDNLSISKTILVASLKESGTKDSQSANDLDPPSSENHNLVTSDALNEQASGPIEQENSTLKSLTDLEQNKMTNEGSQQSGESATNDENEVDDGIFTKVKAFIKKSQENLLSIGSEKKKKGGKLHE